MNSKQFSNKYITVHEKFLRKDDASAHPVSIRSLAVTLVVGVGVSSMFVLCAGESIVKLGAICFVIVVQEYCFRCNVDVFCEVLTNDRIVTSLTFTTPSTTNILVHNENQDSI